MSLSERAMLITLSVSCWTGTRKDDNVVAEVDAKHNAKNSGRFSKFLISKEELESCAAFARGIRAYHYKMTLPWMDNGARLLPANLFREYSTEMRRLKGEYEVLVQAFLQRYEAVLKPDARQRLGTLYDPEDYPAASELQGKFGVATDIMPVPEGNDFRVDVGDAERERIRRELDERVAERQRQAMNDAWRRVREVVSNIELRLSADKTIVRESLIENASELARLLPGLNVTQDPAMSMVCRDITDHLLVDVATLRRSRMARQRVAEKARQILERVPA